MASEWVDDDGYDMIVVPQVIPATTQTTPQISEVVETGICETTAGFHHHQGWPED